MNIYLSKHAFIKEPLIRELPSSDLGIVVVIPAFNEEAIQSTLDDLLLCVVPDPSSLAAEAVAKEAASLAAEAFFVRPNAMTAIAKEASSSALALASASSFEVLVVINHAEASNQEIQTLHETTFYKLSEWAGLHSTANLRFHILYQPDLPSKKAGVGLARKIGMDEAVRRFAAVNNPRGVILCLDADCRVPTNYLSEVWKFFADHPKIEGCSIDFEHPLDGLSEVHRKAITDYEQHLRYFVGMQRWVGLPYAYQTIGSAMAVRADVYCKVGGMNMRQAGEDFYFLHKVIARGAFAELMTTKVYPSPRVSDRVPFGTGRAMTTLLADGKPLTTYNPQSFIDLKMFIDLVPELYTMDGDIWHFLQAKDISSCATNFLKEQHFAKKLAELRSNTASQNAFVKRFFHWFDAFVLMKYLHFARDHYYSNVEVNAVRGAGYELRVQGQSNDEYIRLD